MKIMLLRTNCLTMKEMNELLFSFRNSFSFLFSFSNCNFLQQPIFFYCTKTTTKNESRTSFVTCCFSAYFLCLLLFSFCLDFVIGEVEFRFLL